MTTTDRVKTYTPGPWRRRNFNQGGLHEVVAPSVDGGEGEALIVARCWESADANLIAAATDLLEACERLSLSLKHELDTGTVSGVMRDVHGERLEFARVVIAKAKGGAT